MSTSPRAAVLGIGGIQNQTIAAHLAANGFQVLGTGRQPQPPPLLPQGIRYLSVDANQTDTLARALDGVQIVVLTSPIDHRPGAREQLVLSVVKAAARAGVTRLVFNAAASVYSDRTHPVAKILGALGDQVLAGPVPATVLQPTVYMDNLLAPWARPAILNEGILAYPMPEQAPVSWISHAGLAAFVLAAATQPVVGRTFQIGGPEALTGIQVAERLSQAIGRTVKYLRIPPSALAEGLNAAYGAPTGDDIAALYTTMADQPDVMRRDPKAWADLRVTPESFEQWAHRQAWTAPS